MERKPKKRSGPIVDKLEDISPVDPIPFEGGRGFSYNDNLTYLQFLSPDDQFFKLLIESRLLSATHNACIITKKNYCAGSGFIHKEEDKTLDTNFLKWCKSINLRNESVIEINKKIFESHFTFGNTPIEVVRFTVNNKRYIYAYAQNVLEWRLLTPNPSDGICYGAIQTKMFLRTGFILHPEDINKTRVLPIYNPLFGNKSATKFREGINWLKDSNGTERTIIWYKNSISGFDSYGLPSAIAGLIYQKLEYKGARFNLDNFENNAIVSAMLILKGSLTQPEINKIAKRVVQTHTGDGKRGRIMVTGSEEGIEGSSLHNLETHKEGSYKEADEAWSQKIILVNEWDAVLAGLLNANSLGKGVGFLTKIIENKRKTVIVPAQEDLMDNVWKDIISIAAKWMNFKIDVEEIVVSNQIDISGLTDVDITPAVTVNEVRKAKGLSEDKGATGKKYLGELGADQKRGVYVKNSE